MDFVLARGGIVSVTRLRNTLYLIYTILNVIVDMTMAEERTRRSETTVSDKASSLGAYLIHLRLTFGQC